MRELNETNIIALTRSKNKMWVTIRLILSWSICGLGAGIRGGLVGEAGWSRHAAVAGGGGACGR